MPVDRRTGHPRPHPLNSFRDLVAWQKAMDLVVATHRVADALPHSQRYALADQIRRAAISVPANIAEGAGRLHLGDYVHHLSIARGSTRELESHLELVRRLGYRADPELRAPEELVQEVSRLLHSLIRRLRGSSAPALGPRSRAVSHLLPPTSDLR